MGDLERYAERRMTPELIEYLRGEVARRDAEAGAIHIHIHEGDRPAPPAPAPPDVLAKYTPYMILATWSAMVFGALALVFIWIATALMIVCGSLAVLALAVAATVRSLRMTKHEARLMSRR